MGLFSGRRTSCPRLLLNRSKAFYSDQGLIVKSLSALFKEFIKGISYGDRAANHRWPFPHTSAAIDAGD